MIWSPFRKSQFALRKRPEWQLKLIRDGFLKIKLLKAIKSIFKNKSKLHYELFAQRSEYSSFKKDNFTVLPISRKVSAPGDTPLSLYSKIADKKNNFLFESVEGGERWAQYSIIGFGCIDTIKVSGNTIETSIDGVANKFTTENPLQAIEEITSQHRSPNLEDLPRFHGGYVGFFAYESSQYAEAKIAMLPEKGSKFAEHMPDIM